MAQMLKRKSMGFDNRHCNMSRFKDFCADFDSVIERKRLIPLNLSVINDTRQRHAFLPTPAAYQRVLYGAYQ
jgi:hypothetical protein